MSKLSQRGVFFAGTAAIAVFAASWGCSPADGPAAGTGGAALTSGGSGPLGGGAASGGAGTAGGAASSGGSANVGGSGLGSGGVLAVGGAFGAGGSEANGGSTATGGGNGSGGATSPDVTVQLGITKQKIDGFGINNTWAKAMDDAEADALFDTTKGLGLSILRVGMGSDGNFMSENISGDITKATTRKVKYIIGSCWSPPADWKSGENGVEDPEAGGGHVDADRYTAWADRITKFAKDNKLYAMSIGNEPDFASCGYEEACNGNYKTTLYTADEMVAFVKIAGPKLQAEGIKVIAPEASEWIHNWSDKSATGSVPSNKPSSDPLKCGFDAVSKCAPGKGYDYGHRLALDPVAWAAFDIMGVHQYDTQVGEAWPADVTVGRKPVWQTEMSGVKWWPEQGTVTQGAGTNNGGWNVTGTATIENGVAVAEWVHSALTIGEANAWLWWWYRANNTDDNEGLLLKNGNTVTKRYYTFGNFTRFVRPDYMRVDITGNVPAGVLATAYTGDGKVVVVAINKNATETNMDVTVAGGTAPAVFVPWVTSKDDNLAFKPDVAVDGGKFTAKLAAMSVTTFVSK